MSETLPSTGDPAGGPEPGLPGPYPVGHYAAALRARLRDFARVRVIGELANLRPPTRARVYFELRDADGALPCAMWRNDWDRLGALGATLSDGAQVIVETAKLKAGDALAEPG